MLTYFEFRRITIETTSALHAGSGEQDPVQDMPIQTDCNGLPVVNATSIAGVLRHLCADTQVNELFGDLSTGGSRLIVSDAIPLDENGKPVEGLLISEPSEYLNELKQLMLRDHCAIDHRGTAKNNAKFDRSVLAAGVRFIFELRVGGTDKASTAQEADMLVSLVASPHFRLGGGTRDGFGNIKILTVSGRGYDLQNAADRTAYLQRSSSLAQAAKEPALVVPKVSDECFRKINMTPENFWLFSAGTGYDDLDIRPKVEKRFVWNDHGCTSAEYAILPATSIKGALAHRTAYFYNKLKGVFADKLSEEEYQKAIDCNQAVRSLFGFAIDGEKEKGQRGRVLLSDIYGDQTAAKVFNHVSIDRFTGGALVGALFTEQVMYGGNLSFTLMIEPSEEDKSDGDIRKAFDMALEDLLGGRLPLGGGVNRGLGAMKQSNAKEEN